MLFRLDLDVLRRSLLPEVVRRHLEALERDDFLFAIVAGPSRDQVIYVTAGASAAELAASPDVAMPLDFDAGDGPAQRPPEIGRRGGDRGGPRTRGPGPRRDAYGGWLLVAQHRAGSLDAAVAGLRARNLALSFGILLLLGVAVAMIGVNARRAERLARQQVEFVAGVSHEMRTPVSAIEVAARNLEDGLIGDPARVQRYGRVIGAEARRLGETVERVLQFAAIDAGRVRGTACPVDLALVVEDVVSHARTENPLASFDAAVERACTVQADPGVLRACVRNLVENALKYGGKPGWVRVSLTRRGNGDRMEGCLEVEDRGPGIEASDLPHVFEPFYRGRLATEHRIPGSGLGLHIVKRSIEQMGGEVRVSSRPGTGTTMRLTLPLCPAMSHDDGEPTTRPADRG
jgi:signal transduction histidine kinase